MGDPRLSCENTAGCVLPEIQYVDKGTMHTQVSKPQLPSKPLHQFLLKGCQHCCSRHRPLKHTFIHAHAAFLILSVKQNCTYVTALFPAIQDAQAPGSTGFPAECSAAEIARSRRSPQGLGYHHDASFDFRHRPLRLSGKASALKEPFSS